MGTVTCAEMREMEDEVFSTGVSAEELMDKAGRRLGQAAVRLFPQAGTAVAYIGTGNNGGDALVALGVLREAGWEILVRGTGAELGGLPEKKLGELGEPWVLKEPLAARDCRRPLLLLDGLLGIGAKGPLRAPLGELAGEMNALRQSAGAVVGAVDIPSGVHGDTGEIHPGAVVADVTFTIGAPKRGLLADEAVNHVGRLELIPLEELPVPPTGDRVIVPEELRTCLSRRSHDLHKGGAGRVGLVAGSPGMLGAACLAAQGALRGGAGLVTLFVSPNLYPLMIAAGPPPELMIKPVDQYTDVLDEQLDVLALGPGLGRASKQQGRALLDLLEGFEKTVVLDADGLNLVAASGPEAHLRSGMIVTPHPGELHRLFPGAEGLDRATTARQFVEAFPVTLLLKGARTIVTAREECLHYNSTGTPGMASGGQGDVLTGLIAALIAQGMSPLDAARTGAWLAGRASEIVVNVQAQSEQSLLAGDTAGALGAAFAELQGRR
jgi:NAD(P)H-hydrate epimerase